MSWDDIAKPITMVIGALGALFGIMSTKGVDAIIKLKNSNREERQLIDQQQFAGYTLLYEELKTRIDVLSEQQKRDREELDECRQMHAKADKQNAIHEASIVSQQKEIEKLREWRHKVENDHVAENLTRQQVRGD